MSKSITGPSIYVPTDKNIFDALQHKKVTLSELVYFLRKRGIIVSNQSSKQRLIEKISSLTLGYSDFCWIGKLLENPNRKDKTTHSKLNGEVLDNQIQSACAVVKANLNSLSDDSVKITKKGSCTTLTVTYVDHDFTKTEMRQRTLKTCEIELENSDSGVVIKFPSTKKAKDVSNSLKLAMQAEVTKDKGHELEEFSISLLSITDAAVRSKFFDVLIRNIPGFEFDNVSSVDVYHLDENEKDEFDEDDGASSRFASYINKAALAGEGVLDSTEFSQLHTRGFYIYKIIWTSIDTKNEGPKVEFEARFGKPDSCTDFMYTVRGTYPFNDRTLAHNITRKAATPHENGKYNASIRVASEKALEDTLRAYNKE